MTPEAKARSRIDARLALAGWAVQDMRQLDLGAALFQLRDHHPGEGLGAGRLGRRFQGAVQNERSHGNPFRRFLANRRGLEAFHGGVAGLTKIRDAWADLDQGRMDRLQGAA